MTQSRPLTYQLNYNRNERSTGPVVVADGQLGVRFITRRRPSVSVAWRPSVGILSRFLNRSDDSRVEELSSGPSPRSLALYHYDSCPFCVRVTRVLAGLDADIELRNTQRDPSHRKELIEGGGRSQVPCLRIEGEDGRVTWLYESGDIIKYLTAKFQPA